MRALGALSSLDPNDLGLGNFGSHKPYFPRQIKALSKVTLAQAAVKDIDTGKPVGVIPGWDELIEWYERNLPDERKTGGVRIVHGDFKLDNLIFHPTENRVIGILDWELSTLGSPVKYLSLALAFMTIVLWADVTLACEFDLNKTQLVDLGNLTQPWVIDPDDFSGSMVGFKNSPSTEPISLAELEREYCRATRQPYPITQMTFARSWMLLRVCSSFSLFCPYGNNNVLLSLSPFFKACGHRAGNCGATCATSSEFGAGASLRCCVSPDGQAGTPCFRGRRIPT